MTGSSPHVAVVNPLQVAGWNEKLLRFEQSTIFHSANWASLLADCYGYHPAYLTLSNEAGLRGCLPLMEVSSAFTGRRGVSLSFSDCCSAVAPGEEEFRLLFQNALELGRLSGWRYVEFRGEEHLCRELPARAYAHHVLELKRDEGAMRARFRKGTASSIKKAEKEGVRVELTDSLEGVREYYRLHCLTRRRHGLPPQPESFFEKMHEHVISRGFGFTTLARQGETPVAALICLHFGGNAVYKYGASDQRYRQLSGTNLALWETIRHCAREGMRTLSLGRTDLDNEGLLTFKNGWGAERSDLNYYRYEFAQGAFVKERERSLAIVRTVLRRMPVDLLKLIGRVAYRHAG